MTVDPSAVTAALPGEAPSAKANETVGKYRLDRPLGEGGMGVVWAAFDPDLERAVALKLLRVEATEEASMRTRLLREARAMARLRHANVVTVFDVGTDRGRDYIAMEMVEGGTLDEWLQTKPARGAIIEALIAAGRGLHAAHLAGLVHRDFKPHNVLRGSDGHIYVTDFGLARGQIEEGPELVPMALPLLEVASGSQPRRKRDLILDSPLTQTGVLIGTPAYMAPEQFAGATPDPKSDQFAFCVTAWQALTGERPFRGESLTQIEAAAREGAAKLSAELPIALRAVLVRGLDPTPAARWPDMAALLDALADAATPAKPKRRWLLPMLGGAMVVASGVILLIATQRSKSAEEDCGPAEAAFDKILTPSRTAAVDVNIGTKLVLKGMRKQWIRSYTAACRGEQTAEKREVARCLRNARDEIGRVLDRTRTNQLDTGSLAEMTTGVIMCDPKSLEHMGDFNPDIDEPEPPDPPDPPEVVPPKP